MKSVSLLALCLSLASLPIAATCLCLDDGDSDVRFEVTQDGSPFEGRFHRFGGKVCFDGTRVTSVDIWLSPASVDTGLAELDEVLQGPDLFDTATHPRATFVSNEIRAEAGHQIATGPLTIKGITHQRAVTLTVRTEGELRIVQGEITFPRLDYEVGVGEWADTVLLRDQVTIRFRGRLARATRAEAPARTSPPDP